MIRRLLVLTILIVLTVDKTFPMSDSAYRIGVLANPSIGSGTLVFQPTVDHLNRTSYGLHFELLPLGASELHEAVAGRRIDFILTSPDQLVDLQSRYRVSALASLVRINGGLALRETGGVIVVRGDRTDLAGLENLRRKTVVAGDRSHLPGYLAQAGELAEAGIDVSRDCKLDTGFKPEQIVQAVARGHADAGFLPAGAVEAMASEGGLREESFRVLTPRKTEGFPFMLSTQLYPELVFASLAHVPESAAKQVAMSLLAVRAGNPPPWRGDLVEWTLPLDAEPVHRLMRALRLPPYDRVGNFGWRDVLRKYEFEAFALLAIALTLLFAIATKFRRLNHRLAGQMMLTYQRRQELEAEIVVRQQAESRLAGANAILSALASASPLAVILERLIAMHQKERPGKPVAVLLFETEQCRFTVAAHGNIDADFMREIESAAAIIAADGSPGPGMSRLCKRCGSMLAEPVRSEAGARLACLLMASPISDNERQLVQSMASLAALSIQRADASNRLRLNASVFENALEGIIVADPAGNIIDINAAFTRLTGYERDDAIGNNPRFLQSGRHDKAFYVSMWASLGETGEWLGEIWNRRKEGQVMIEVLHIVGVRDPAGQLTHYVGTFSDITLLKETQARLNRATYGTSSWPE